MDKRKEELEKLALIAADPFASEELWLPACTAAGNKSLVSAGSLSSRIYFVTIARFLAVVFLSTGAVSAFHMINGASSLILILHSIDPNTTVLLDCNFTYQLAAVVVIMGSFGFWLNFAFRRLRTRSVFALAWIAVACAYFASGPSITSAATAICALFAFYASARLGKAISGKVGRRNVDGILKCGGVLSLFAAQLVGVINTASIPGVGGLIYWFFSYLNSLLSSSLGSYHGLALGLIALAGPVIASERLTRNCGVRERISMAMLFLAPNLAGCLVLLIVPGVAIAFSSFVSLFFGAPQMWGLSVPGILLAFIELFLISSSVYLICLVQRLISSLAPHMGEYEGYLLTADQPSDTALVLR